MFQVKICGITTPDDARAAAQAGTDAIGLNFYAKSPRCISPETARSIIAALPKGVVKVGLFVNAALSDVCQLFDDLSLDLIQLHGDEPPEFLAQLGGRPVMRAFRVGAAGLPPVVEYLRRCRELTVGGDSRRRLLGENAHPRRRESPPTAHPRRRESPPTAHPRRRESPPTAYPRRRESPPTVAETAAVAMPVMSLFDSLMPGVYGGTGARADWSAAKEYVSQAELPPLVLAGGLTAENVAEAIRAVRPAAVDTAGGVESSPGRKDSVLMQAFVRAARAAFAAL